MSNELWFHALKVLDSFRSSSDSQDVYKLYEFNDETGILHKHKEHLESRFENEPQNAGVKTMYHELIKMLMDQDMRQSPEGFKQTRDVDKIGGFQELTNRLQFNLNERYMQQIFSLGQRIQRFEDLLKGQDVLEKLEQLEQKMYQIQDDAKDKFEELNNEVADNATRISSTENQNIEQGKQIDYLSEDLKAKDDHEATEKMIADSIVKFQTETLDTLSKRIDQNENHIKLLETKDDDLDEKIDNVEERLESLEKADDYLQKAYEGYMTKAQKIEDDETSLGKDFGTFKEDFDKFKEDQDLLGEKVNGKIQTLNDNAHDIQDENEKIKEQIKQLEGVSNDNAEVINKFTISQNTFEDKFDKLEKDTDEIMETMDKIEGKAKDTDDKLDNLNNDLKKAVDDTTDDLDKFKSQANDKFQNLDDQLTNIQNDLNGNKQKIEDANGVIKRHTEQLIELEPEINDLKHEMSELDRHVKGELGDKLEKVKADITDKVGIEHFKAGQNILAAKDDELNDRINHNLEKIINLEESNVIQQQKAKYVDTLNERLTMEIEAKQQSEAKTKEELNEKLKDNLDAVNEAVNERINDLTAKNNECINEIGDLKDKSLDIEEKVDSLKSGTDQLRQRLADLGLEKEKLVDEVDHVSNMNKNLVDQIGTKISGLENQTKDIKDDVNALSKKNEVAIEKLEDEVNGINGKLKDSVKNEIEDLVEKVNEKLDEIDNESKANAGHVDNLREVNKELLERIKVNVQDDIDKQTENIEKSGKAIDALEDNLKKLLEDVDDLKNNEINDLVDAKTDLENKVKDLEENSKKLDENLKTEHEKLVLIINNSKETHDKVLKEITEKLVVVEKAQDNIDIQMIKETIDSLEDKYSKTQEDRNEMANEIKILDDRHQRNHEDLDNRRDSDAQFNKTAVLKLETALDTNHEDMWNVVLPIYGALRGYTVVLYSEGMARDHQSACLGIFRSSSYLNGRPVYKQDDGENYLYYHKAENSWLVGPHVGNNYAWVRNQLDQSMSSSSTSSSDDSDSDSDDSVASNSDHSIGSSAAKKTAKSKRKWLSKSRSFLPEIRTPDQLESGWQYRLSITVGQQAVWTNDDSTLRVEALKDVDRISKVIRRVRAAKEID